ncbi:MAG: cobyric acid synthase [Nitrospirae bacterium]|nr:cobyric acid synthase [Nitrospirota bacterium]
MAKALMIQGTGSGAGKSLVAAAMCRIFRDSGIDVAPFKAQNMALNSYITAEGGEIGRAQALQAEAAGIEPSVDMNPILLKASGDMGSQVIIHGKVHAAMKAQEYYAFKKEAWKAVKASFGRLSKKHDLIVIEGAGSPAEINLMDVDIVNMAVAKHAKAPVLLIGDIDKGGVFASLYGTVKLLGRQSRHIKAFIINKFRGDMDILRPGLDMIQDRTGKPVIGVLPYISAIGLPEEDGLSLQRISKCLQPSALSLQPSIKIVIVKLQYISNFTDFDPFLYEPDVELIYSTNPADIENADLVVIPGSKNTVKDLMFIKEQGLDKSIKLAYSKGVRIIGMCGGYQMLGKKIYDPHSVESNHKEVDGIGLLNIETLFEKTKVTSQTIAEIHNPDFLPFSLQPSAFRLKGYEIHMGVSEGDIGLFRIKRLPDKELHLLDGSKNGNCWGTYLHGIFESDLFRRAVINDIRVQKGLPSADFTYSYHDMKEKAIDNLSDIIRENIDMNFIKGIAGL